LEKYGLLAKAVGGFVPFFLIMFLSMGASAQVGRKMAVTGVLTFMYITYELKKPSESSVLENEAVRFFNEHHSHPLIVKWFGPTHHWTIH